MSKNQLKFLTDDFCNLVNLKHLDLYNNQLENLPLNFGKLTKLRYLDLKGNPLQPALLKIVGPCLTTKDCLDSAKQVVPFMIDLEVKFQAEQKKREDAENKRREEEAQVAREQARLAKKAARKERVMRERQQKAESENLLEPKELDSSDSNDTSKEAPVKSSKSRERNSFATNFLSFLKTFFSVLIIFVGMFILFMKFVPDQSAKVISVLPKSQQDIIRFSFEKIDGSILRVFQKVLNLYKI